MEQYLQPDRYTETALSTPWVCVDLTFAAGHGSGPRGPDKGEEFVGAVPRA